MLVMLFPCMLVLEMRNAMDINDHLILFRSDRCTDTWYGRVKYDDCDLVSDILSQHGC